ncbi:MAG: hypothetical protein IT572_09645 [Deltaproteobacteria bacterium]|nr:hypothetical protein [Deltaproteobacteria bacterium]
MFENLPAEVKAAFEDYLKSANKLVPDPKDDAKFFKFVILCHQKNATIESIEIYEILEKQGFDEAMQDHLVILLEGGRELLKEYDKALGR